MEIDDRREILTYNRTTGPKSDQMGPIINKENVNLKTPLNTQRALTGYKILNRSHGTINNQYTRNKKPLNYNNYRTSSDFINTLKNNPLVNNLIH